jgi:hypothetical protein
MSGYNPLRWDCEVKGCFNKKKRPKIEILADSLPGRCCFGDVDAIAEINGRGLFIEWKATAGSVPTGQKILHERLTKTGLLSTIVVAGNAETMEVHHMAKFFMGKWIDWNPATLDDVKSSISSWATWAQRQVQP